MNFRRTNTLLIMVLFFVIGWNYTCGTKTQSVRLLDIFIYGSVLMYISLYKLQEPVLQILVLFFGVTTISYNLKNYIIENKKKKSSSKSSV